MGVRAMTNNRELLHAAASLLADGGDSEYRRGVVELLTDTLTCLDATFMEDRKAEVNDLLRMVGA